METIFPEQAHTIFLIQPSTLKAEDSFYWFKTKSGLYSVKYGYYALRDEATNIEIPQEIRLFKWQSFVWKEATSPKLKLFLWKLARGALPLVSSLQTRGIDTAGRCPHCNELETAVHLFFLCPLVKKVWEIAPFRSCPSFPTDPTLHDCFTIMSMLVCLPPTGISTNLTSWLLWGIWTARNLLLFENRAVQAKVTMEKAVIYAWEWLLVQAAATKRPVQNQGITELPSLPPNVAMCEVDAVWLPSLRAGLGWCFKQTSTNLYTEGARSLESVSSPLMAEALAMRAAIQDAKRNSLLNV